MLALGDAGGTLHIFQLPWSLCNPSSKEVRQREEQKPVFRGNGDGLVMLGGMEGWAGDVGRDGGMGL